MFVMLLGLVMLVMLVGLLMLVMLVWLVGLVMLVGLLMFAGSALPPSPDHSSQATLGLVSTWMGDRQKWPSRKTEFSFFVALHKAGSMPL